MSSAEPHVHHPAPSAIDERASTAGLRAVATFEAAKGLLVIVLGLALLAFHSRVEDYVEVLLFHLHINPDRRLGQVLLETASRISDLRIWMIAGAAVTYATVRFVEAWGLWNRRVWAEWFALLSGAMYLPLEILKIAQKSTWEHIAVFGINLIIVLYMLEIRIRASRGDVVHRDPEPTAETTKGERALSR
jgi:uncharacterized membrane protein (DUF2068 family)